MSENRSPTLQIRAGGPLACFTRPELKTERVSYQVMTPSAARGLLEAVLWKPAIVWRIERIKVLSEIKFTAFRRNEVNKKAALPSIAAIGNGGTAPVLFADEDRAQRNTVALKDVDYLIEAHFEMTDKAGSGDNINKFVDMFNRRIQKGQHFHQPCLGCREFAARVEPADNAPQPINESRNLGLMLWDIHYSAKGNRAVFFDARLENGVMDAPDTSDGLFTRIGSGGRE